LPAVIADTMKSVIISIGVLLETLLGRCLTKLP